MALCCKSFTVSGGQKLGNDYIGAPYVLVNNQPSYNCPIGKAHRLPLRWPEFGVPVSFAPVPPKIHLQTDLFFVNGGLGDLYLHMERELSECKVVV